MTGEHPCENVSDRARNRLRKDLRHLSLEENNCVRAMGGVFVKNEDFSIDKRGLLSKRLPNICIQVAPIFGSCILPTYSHLDGAWLGDSNINVLRLFKKDISFNKKQLLKTESNLP